MKMQMPTVEKGIPIPTHIRKDERNRSRSQWPAFLESLQPGDSFVVSYPQCYNATAVARWMKIPIVKMDLPRERTDRMAKARIWRIPDGDTSQTEGDREGRSHQTERPVDAPKPSNA